MIVVGAWLLLAGSALVFGLANAVLPREGR